MRSTHPFLEDLAKATGETVELTVESAQGAVVVDQVATSHPFKPNLPTGRILGNMANSAVRMWVAMRPEEERARLLREPQLKFTPHTTTDPEELAAMLERAAAEGVAYDLEEQDLGVCAVSAPVFGPGGDVLAVLTVVAPVRPVRPRGAGEEHRGGQEEGGRDDGLFPQHARWRSVGQRLSRVVRPA